MGKRTEIRGHTASRKGKIVSIRGHSRDIKYSRSIISSCVNAVKQDAGGNNYITIRGVDYPYPLLPKERVSGVVNAGSAGKYYNKNIRGRYF